MAFMPCVNFCQSHPGSSDPSTLSFFRSCSFFRWQICRPMTCTRLPPPQPSLNTAFRSPYQSLSAGIIHTMSTEFLPQAKCCRFETHPIRTAKHNNPTSTSEYSLAGFLFCWIWPPASINNPRQWIKHHRHSFFVGTALIRTDAYTWCANANTKRDIRGTSSQCKRCVCFAGCSPSRKIDRNSFGTYLWQRVCIIWTVSPAWSSWSTPVFFAIQERMVIYFGWAQQKVPSIQSYSEWLAPLICIASQKKSYERLSHASQCASRQKKIRSKMTDRAEMLVDDLGGAEHFFPNNEDDTPTQSLNDILRTLSRHTI